MNNVGNLDYSINTTIKGNKLVIEYNGAVFKDNPSLVTKKTNDVMVKETPYGFHVEMDLKKKKYLNFSINNVNNEEVRRQTNEQLSLIVPEKDSIWNKFKISVKKINLLGLNKTVENIKEIK